MSMQIPLSISLQHTVVEKLQLTHHQMRKSTETKSKICWREMKEETNYHKKEKKGDLGQYQKLYY